MTPGIKKIINLHAYRNSLAENDLVNLQKLRLFKKATFISLFVFIGFTVQVMVVLPGNFFLLVTMFALFGGIVVNYFLLDHHRSASIAYTVLLSTWFILLHIDTYYSGGIRNAANVYFAVLILTAYMLLGSKGGKTMAAFALLHLAFFYVITTQTNWVNYDLVGQTDGLIDLYFFLATTVSLLVLTFQSAYIETNKKAVIEVIEADRLRLEKSGERLEIKNQELQQKNTELEEFAYLASHDLQEPLKTSSGLAQLMKRQYEGKLDEKADQYLTFIVDSALRMKKLVQDLLGFSRSGHQGKYTPIDCMDMISELLEDLDQLVTDTSATIVYQRLPIIKGYGTEIKLLFLNLIVNAIKFARPGVAPRVEITAERSGNFWRFAVADNGIGIPREYYEKIFGMFQRLQSNADFKGSGIGLAHCKKIVELHKGTIWVESTLGEGSTFYFNIEAS
jgi:signal transduction histidine kinase